MKTKKPKCIICGRRATVATPRLWYMPDGPQGDCACAQCTKQILDAFERVNKRGNRN